jgi:hypothetical protein
VEALAAVEANSGGETAVVRPIQFFNRDSAHGN